MELLKMLGSLVFVIGLGHVIALIIINQEKISRIAQKKANAQRRELAILSEAQKEFYVNTGRRIHTLINTITELNSNILKIEAIPKLVRNNTESIQSANRMLLSLIDDILDMNTVTEEAFVVYPSRYETSRLINDVVSIMEPRAIDKNLSLSVQIAPNVPEVLVADENRIKQILVNMLGNAVKYTPKGSVELAVEADREEGEKYSVRYIIKDTGIGIKKEDLDKLFTPYKRADGYKNREVEGTGLGLFVAVRWAKLMGGHISVESEYGTGSRFTVCIPQSFPSEAEGITTEANEHKGVDEKADYIITTESSAGIPGEICKNLHIEVLSLTIETPNGARYFDEEVKTGYGRNIGYDLSKLSLKMPSREKILQFFEDAHTRASNIIHIAGERYEKEFYDNLKLAGELDYVTVIDSGLFSAGLFLMCIESADIIQRDDRDWYAILQKIYDMQDRIISITIEPDKRKGYMLTRYESENVISKRVARTINYEEIIDSAVSSDIISGEVLCIFYSGKNRALLEEIRDRLYSVNRFLRIYLVENNTSAELLSHSEFFSLAMLKEEGL